MALTKAELRLKPNLHAKLGSNCCTVRDAHRKISPHKNSHRVCDVFQANQVALFYFLAKFSSAAGFEPVSEKLDNFPICTVSGVVVAVVVVAKAEVSAKVSAFAVDSRSRKPMKGEGSV